MDNEWLENLKVGDNVLYSGRYREYFVGTVTRITKTQVIVKINAYENKFRKKDGFVVGGDIWNTSLIREYDENILETQKKEERRKSLISEIRNTGLGKLSLEALEGIHAKITAEILSLEND
jgi:hypothetical protein